jgi:hypothetical protein
VADELLAYPGSCVVERGDDSFVNYAPLRFGSVTFKFCPYPFGLFAGLRKPLANVGLIYKFFDGA